MPQGVSLRRSKRIRAVKAHITTELYEQLELCLQEEPAVVTMSDYLFGVIEEHVALKSIRVLKPRSSRRVVNS
jgi:hypothetical protein